jgi:APA family basic amino acid/polyamine antiporter
MKIPKRTINLKSATGIVIANMIGSGVFVTAGIIAGKLPNPTWVLSFWIIGGIIALLGALCYSELATRMPEGGGEYIYLGKLFHPIFGFLAGWTSFIVGFSAPIAGSALGFSEYIFSGLNIENIYSQELVIILKKGLSVVIVLVFTILHYRGIKTGVFVQNIFVVIKVVAIIGLVLAGFILYEQNFSYLTGGVEVSSNDIAFGTAMMLIMFSYSGWNAVSYIAGEIKNPRRNIPFSLILGTLIVTAFYIILNLLILVSLPFNDVQGEITVIEKVFVNIFGDFTGNSLSIVIGILLVSSLSAFILIGPRIYYAMAKDRLFFRFASKIHPVFEVPSRSIAIQGSIAIFFVIFSSIEQLFIYLYYALNLFPIMAVFGIFIARKRKIGNNTSVNVIGYPIVPVIFLVFSIYLAVIAFVERPIESIAAIATILFGIPCYYIFLRFTSNDNKGLLKNS